MKLGGPVSIGYGRFNKPCKISVKEAQDIRTFQRERERISLRYNGLLSHSSSVDFRENQYNHPSVNIYGKC